MDTYSLRGIVVNDGRTPQQGATVRLYSPLEPLGSDPRAALLNPSAVTWSRAVTDFEGSAWNAWQRFVADHTAGITWPEFRQALGDYNPGLRASEGAFRTSESYFIPENRPLEFARDPFPDIVWDRSLTAFEGTLWDCWQQFVRNKVMGLDWERFQVEFATHNPQGAETGGRLRADIHYRLPRSVDNDHFYRLEYTDDRGRFRFEHLLPGEYGLEVQVAGYHTYRQPLVIDQTIDISVELEPIPLAVEKGVEDFVRVQGTEFVLQGQTFRFIGVNLRGLIHYGDRNTLSHSEEADRMEQLTKANEMGARVVRVFLPSEHAETATIITRLEQVLGLIRSHFPHMRLIIALTNFYDDNPFKVRDDHVYYTLKPKESDRYKLLTPAWFEGGDRRGFEEHYKPFVTEVIKRFRDKPEIMAWEPGNEMKVDDNPELFLRFMLGMTRYIKRLTPNHLVTTGITSTRVAYMAPHPNLQRQLYGDPSIDFITNHAYNGTNEEDDSGLAQMLGKPLLIEEAGFDAGRAVDVKYLSPCVRDGRRVDCVKADMQKWFGRGARGYMQWGFMSGFNNGDGDHLSGMDQTVHEDWNDLFGAYQSQAHLLTQQSTAVAVPSKPTPVPPASLKAGTTVHTTTVVNVRRSPGYQNKVSGDILGQALPGTSVRLLGASEERDSLIWWPVEVQLRTGVAVQGWMAQTNGEAYLLQA